jgi:hypothetical protein
MGFVLGLYEIALHQSLVSVIVKRLRITVAVASEQADKQHKKCATNNAKDSDQLTPNHAPRTSSPMLLTNEHSTSPLRVAAEESQCSLSCGLVATEKMRAESLRNKAPLEVAIGPKNAAKAKKRSSGA